MNKSDWEVLAEVAKQGYRQELVASGEDSCGLINQALHTGSDAITDVELLSKGMTNHLMAFRCRGKRYFMRLPGEGANQLINRYQEEAVYRTIDGQNISDRVVYFDAASGYKISEFVENGKTCNDKDPDEVKRCIDHLKRFHGMELSVEHSFDPFEKSDYYRSLWEGESSFPDYNEMREKIFSLKKIIDCCPGKHCLCHIDPNCDNFLLTEQQVYLIDWEYAGMCDPHIDIAMFAIYSGYSQQEVDWLIDLYFDGKCNAVTRLKIYCYIAVSGFLWAGWCDYKKRLGVHYDEYALTQYQYAKDYYHRATELAARLEKTGDGYETM